MKRLTLRCTLAIALFIIVAGSVSAQDYKIGPGDELSITFWQAPQLNSTVRVDQRGAIVLPVIGSITAAGLTPNELTLKIVRKMSVFNKDISQAAVTVTQYGSNTVYVTGSVMNPGKYSFEVIPDLWKIILEAGGATENALLSQVQIIRGGDKVGEVTPVDLTEFLSNGDITLLPPVYAGDAIRIPGSIGTSTGAEASAMISSEGQIYIYGQVANPGTYSFVHNLNLLDAIVLAGGPSTDAQLDQVKVIIRGEKYSSVATVDLKKYSQQGAPAPFLLRAGDTIFIPQRKGIFGSELTVRLLEVAATAAVTVLIWNQLR